MPPTNPPSDLVLSSRRVVLPQGERPATVVARNGRIIDVRDYEPTSGEDLGDLALLPGLVDPHVHLNEPGRAEWEGFASGTAAAAAGGVTTLIDMPLNSSPVTTSVAALAAKREAAVGLCCDVAFHAGLVPGNVAELPTMLNAGAKGVKAFLCDSGLDAFPAVGRAELAEAMPEIARCGAVLLAHAEVARPMPPLPNPRSYADYLASRPADFEQQAIAMLIELCEATGCRTHIVHLADADSLPLLASARQRGLPITVETCPHYLTFAAEEVADGATAYKCAPPIRDASHRERLWRGLADGLIDLIASDHSPCPPAMKLLEAGRFDQAWGGISSLQLGLPAVWTEAARRGHTLTDVARWMSTAPADLFGIEGGIRIGAPANLVVFEADRVWDVDPQVLLHRHKITPYAGRRFHGLVVRTYLHGAPAAPGRGKCL